MPIAYIKNQVIISFSPFERLDYNQNKNRDHTQKVAIYYSAPTVSEALDYIREEKGIICYVQFEYIDGVMWYGTIIQNDEQMTPLHTDSFDTHPLANSALLTAVLEYLEKKVM